MSIPRFMKQVLNVPERERVANVHHDREADDLGRGLEVPEMRALLIRVRLAALPVGGNPIFL